MTWGRACLPFISQRARNQVARAHYCYPLCRVRESSRDEGCFYTAKRSSRETVNRNTDRGVAAVFPVVIKTFLTFLKASCISTEVDDLGKALSISVAHFDKCDKSLSLIFIFLKLLESRIFPQFCAFY